MLLDLLFKEALSAEEIVVSVVLEFAVGLQATRAFVFGVGVVADDASGGGWVCRQEEGGGGLLLGGEGGGGGGLEGWWGAGRELLDFWDRLGDFHGISLINWLV